MIQGLRDTVTHHLSVAVYQRHHDAGRGTAAGTGTLLRVPGRFHRPRSRRASCDRRGGFRASVTTLAPGRFVNDRRGRRAETPNTPVTIVYLVTGDRTTSWAETLDRAGELAALSVVASEPQSWDTVATRGLIAVALHSIAVRTATPVGDVPLAQLLVPLLDEGRLTALVDGVLAGPDLPARTAEPDDPVAAQWAWLRREWDPDAAPGQRWDGLRRGIAWGLPDSAVVVCLGWAASAVSRALAAERGTLRPGTTVDIVGGEFAGAQGRVEHPAWTLDDTAAAIAPGMPSAYIVTVVTPSGPQVGQILRTHMNAIVPAE